eukprot:TRINITY_DN16357_c0_g1_i1.p1 TRINITY_DN16357_c0_g1~~TRINITY_DN16357_c0_g1_i1.p1  ORF type:complete len:673 (-),score=140.62 TRINITY_DN16357_c0_g1_i1:36-2054(-)
MQDKCIITKEETMKGVDHKELSDSIEGTAKSFSTPGSHNVSKNEPNENSNAGISNHLEDSKEEIEDSKEKSTVNKEDFSYQEESKHIIENNPSKEDINPSRANDSSYMDRGPNDEELTDMQAVSIFDENDCQEWEEFIDLEPPEVNLDPFANDRGVRYRRFGRRGRRGNYRGHRGGREYRPREELNNLPLKESPIVKGEDHIAENLKYYNMFPEIKDLSVINKAVKSVNLKNVKKQLVDTVVGNAIYREYAISQMEELIEARNMHLQRQKEAAKVREEKMLERRHEAIKKSNAERRKGKNFEDAKEEPIAAHHMSSQDIINKNEAFWTENAIKGMMMYENETGHDRELLIAYHITGCIDGIFTGHEPNKCLFYHSQDEQRRRPLFYKGEWSYYPVMCTQGKEHNKQIGCEYAHNWVEINYHLLTYRTTICEWEKEECKTHFCHKAHEKNELRDIVALFYTSSHSEALQPMGKPEPGMSQSLSVIDVKTFDVENYKTRLCKNKECKDKDCLDYHNALERRRNLSVWHYENKHCAHTYKNKYLNPANCPKGDNCGECHTKNEFWYHPKNYKANPCGRSPCLYNERCPSLHEDEIEKLKERFDKLEVNVEKLKKKENDLKCPVCKKLVEGPDDAVILLCCASMVCIKCVEHLEICIKCKKEVENVTKFNNDIIKH